MSSFNIFVFILRILSLNFILFGTISTAFAHAAERVFVVNLPLNYYYATGGMIVFLTFVLLLYVKRINLPTPRIILIFPQSSYFSVRYITSSCSFLILILLLFAGFFGNRDPLENILVLTIWTILWVGVTLATVVFGNIWNYLNPWHAPVITVRFIACYFLKRTDSKCSGSKNCNETSPLYIFINKLGYVPAIIGLAGFAWLEIISLAPNDPYILAQSVIIYWLIIFTIAAYQGEAWLKQGEFLTVFFHFLGKVAPLWLTDDNNKLMLSLPGHCIVTMELLSKSAVAFLILVLASVSFDGFSDSFFWLQLIGVNPLDFQGRSSVMGVNSIGLLGMWLLMALLILSMIALSCAIAWRKSFAFDFSFSFKQNNFWYEIGRIVATFLPISAAYHIAHYYTALLINGQYAIQALSDPFGLGWNIFNLPPYFVTTSFMTTHSGQLTIWNFQSALIVIGHMVAIILTYLCSTIGISNPENKIRNKFAHLPMSLLMVLYTIFGLWLLSTRTGA